MDRATPTFWYEHAAAQLPDDDRSRWEKTKEGLRNLFKGPSTGRTTALGRKVEKPGDQRAAGPSGQTDSTWHDSQHTNK
jgi:hypothetical protein